MPRQYRKKPVVIEAARYDGRNASEITQWVGDSAPRGVEEHFSGGLIIGTLEGDMRADVGDWIIRGVQGEFYPCKPDIFEQTYEAV